MESIGVASFFSHPSDNWSVFTCTGKMGPLIGKETTLESREVDVKSR